jgi:hypothetical protein
MGRPDGQMRIVQLACIFVLLLSFRLALRVEGSTHGSPIMQWIIAFLALVCSMQGFSMQRRIVSGSSRNRQRSGRSTALTRWRAGNVARLAFATAVGLYGLLLSEFGGAPWMVNSLFAIALILLLIWKPGISPNLKDI